MSVEPVDLIDDIRESLPGATQEQIEKFAALVNRLKGLEEFFGEFPEDVKPYQDSLTRAAKALNYKEPYRIAVIGVTGTGKSTLINAMLGRDLVLMKDLGKPATGAALQIFLDADDEAQEKAEIHYRTEEDIRHLIREFVNRYKVQGLNLTSELNSNFAAELLKLEAPSSLTTEKEKNEFRALSESFSDLVQQFLNNRDANLDFEFYLADATAREELKQLTDENSDVNREDSSQRRIGLIKSVTYHVKPDSESQELNTLQLPKNVCLMDLPGLDGTPLHDIIIGEGVEMADAVVFILRPPRILGRGDTYLISRVKKHLRLESNSASNERIFVVLNARDQIMRDKGNFPQNLPRDMTEFLELLMPNYLKDSSLSKRGENEPYFMTSAWAAYYAQKSIKGEVILDREKYDATKISLGVRDSDDFQVLEASQVPQLVKSITEFAREHRIDGQLREGQLTLESIFSQLKDSYQLRKSQLTEDRGEYYFREKLYKQLEEQKSNLQEEIIQLRQEILKVEQFERQKQLLERQAKSICDEVDKQLLLKMPELWKDHYKRGIDRLLLASKGMALPEPLLAEAQIFVWKQLNALLPGLGEILVEGYRNYLQTYKMTQRIVRGVYEFVEASEIDLILEDEINKMHKSISSVSNRIAMIRMTDTDTYFTQLNNEKKFAKEELARSISKINGERNLSSESFRELVKVIRKEYEESVLIFCVLGLLNLYRYELILVEDKLCNKVGEVFESMRDQNETFLRAKIQGESGDPEWKEAVGLQQKLDKLVSAEN